jgi:hypothetical protein
MLQNPNNFFRTKIRSKKTPVLALKLLSLSTSPVNPFRRWDAIRGANPTNQKKRSTRQILGFFDKIQNSKFLVHLKEPYTILHKKCSKFMGIKGCFIELQAMYVDTAKWYKTTSPPESFLAN